MTVPEFSAPVEADIYTPPVIDRMARAYWRSLTPGAARHGLSYEADPYAWQYREAAQAMYAVIAPTVCEHELALACEALREITEKRGHRVEDPYEHACNIIDYMAEVAETALRDLLPEPTR